MFILKSNKCKWEFNVVLNIRDGNNNFKPGNQFNPNVKKT